MCYDCLFAVGEDEVRGVDCGVIHRCLIKHFGCEGNMFGFELKEHERLQVLGINDCVTTFVHAGAYGYRHFHTDERLRVAELFYQLAQECLPDYFLRFGGYILAPERAI